MHLISTLTYEQNTLQAKCKGKEAWGYAKVVHKKEKKKKEKKTKKEIEKKWISVRDI